MSEIPVNKKIVLQTSLGEYVQPYIVTDSSLSTESSNPIQNQAVTTELNECLRYSIQGSADPTEPVSLYHSQLENLDYEHAGHTGFLKDDASNLTSDGQKVFDGQWITKNWRIYTNESCVNSSGATITNSIDFSSYLPNDKYSYEVYMTYWIAANDPTNVGTSTILSSSFVHNIGVDSSNVATNVYSYISQANKYRIDSTHIVAHAAIGSMIVIINPAPYRKVNFQYYTGANGYVSDLTAALYRRIGTNQ